MASLDKTTPSPTELKLHQNSQVLEIAFADGMQFKLPYELLRVYSPSAEVRGHGPGEEVLQVGKKGIQITQVEPVGAYAVQLTFSDGHDTGLYSWDYFYHLGVNHKAMWTHYLQRMEAAGASRDPAPGAFAQRPKSK